MELELATIKPIFNLSGYVYLHLPSHVVASVKLSRESNFRVVFSDGALIIKQEVNNAGIMGNKNDKG